jgi:hypothetical protein
MKKTWKGILFAPSRILHSGLLATRGPRVVVTHRFFPSPIPRRVALDRGGVPRLEAEGKWRAEASRSRDPLGGGEARSLHG